MIAPGLDVNLDHELNRESQGCDVVTQSDSVGLGIGGRSRCLGRNCNFHVLVEDHLQLIEVTIGSCNDLGSPSWAGLAP